MKKKKLNIDGVLSELTGASAFFPGYRREPAEEQEKTDPDAKRTKPLDDSTSVAVSKGVPPPVPRTVPRTPGELIPKKKRPIRQRQPFDIYEDQYQTLKKISEAEKDFVNGRGMSQMVRDAIDAYLKAQTSPQK